MARRRGTEVEVGEGSWRQEGHMVHCMDEQDEGAMVGGEGGNEETMVLVESKGSRGWVIVGGNGFWIVMVIHIGEPPACLAENDSEIGNRDAGCRG